MCQFRAPSGGSELGSRGQEGRDEKVPAGSCGRAGRRERSGFIRLTPEAARPLGPPRRREQEQAARSGGAHTCVRVRVSVCACECLCVRVCARGEPSLEPGAGRAAGRRPRCAGSSGRARIPRRPQRLPKRRGPCSPSRARGPPPRPERADPPGYSTLPPPPPPLAGAPSLQRPPSPAPPSALAPNANQAAGDRPAAAAVASSPWAGRRGGFIPQGLARGCPGTPTLPRAPGVCATRTCSLRGGGHWAPWSPPSSFLRSASRQPLRPDPERLPRPLY